MNWFFFQNQLNELCVSYQNSIHLAVHYKDHHYEHRSDEEINGDNALKLPVVMAMMAEVEKGERTLRESINIDSFTDGPGILTYLHDITTVQLHNLMKLSILVSDHTASNTLLTLLTQEKLMNFINQFNCQHTMLFKPFMSHNRMRDNFTCASDMMVFLKLIGEPNPYFNEESRRHLYGMLYDQYKSQLFVAHDLTIPPTIQLANMPSTTKLQVNNNGIYSKGPHRLYVSLFITDVHAAPVIRAKLNKICIEFLESL